MLSATIFSLVVLLAKPTGLESGIAKTTREKKKAPKHLNIVRYSKTGSALSME